MLVVTEVPAVMLDEFDVELVVLDEVLVVLDEVLDEELLLVAGTAVTTKSQIPVVPSCIR